MRIILVRHGDSAMSSDKWHGITDEHLSGEGRTEVYKHARELKKYNPVMIYTCPTQRNVDTARILADELHIPVKKNDALLPLDLGKFVGKSRDKHLSEVRHYLMNPNETIPGGQSVNEWAKQYLPFFERYFKNKSDQTIIFVTHGRNIILTKAYLKDGGLAPRFDKDLMVNHKTTTERGGYALVTPPNKLEIVNSKPTKGGLS
jgi:broad specificity phosphatase PhoE